METVVPLITQVGFPIACVIALGFFIRSVYDTMVEKSGAREERLYKVIADAQAQNQRLSDINAEFADVMRAYKADLEKIKEDVTDIKEYINRKE